MTCVQFAFAMKSTSVEDDPAPAVDVEEGNTGDAEEPAGIYSSYATHTETYSEEDQLQLQ